MFCASFPTSSASSTSTISNKSRTQPVEGHYAKIKEWVINAGPFARAWIKNPMKQGTFIPLSPYVADAMLKQFIPLDERPCHYLEAGAGTGAITAGFVKNYLRPQDTLSLVELDKNLCYELQKRFAQHPNVKVYNSAIEEWVPSSDGPQQFDGLISTIPFNSLPSTKELPSAELLKKILKAFERLTKKGKPFAHANYVGTATLCKVVCFIRSIFSYSQNLFQSRNSLKDFIEMTTVWHNFIRHHSLEQTVERKNIPFAWITSGTIR